MSREIKFRAFVKSTQKMASWNDILEYRSQSLCDLHDYIEDDDSVVMQYTGLKDKNGVEIYEGDIVTFVDYDREHEDEYINKGVIEYSHNAFYITNRNLVDVEDIDFETEVEVIGNIYETPELLKQLDQ